MTTIQKIEYRSDEVARDRAGSGRDRRRAFRQGLCLAGLIQILASGLALGAGEGPGFPELYQLHRLPEFRTSIKVGSFSSYDRSGGNDDGFSGKDSFLRKEPDGGLVLAELKGPGVIYRIWTPTPTDDWLEFFMDGEAQPRLRVRFREMFLGTHPRFPKPLVSFGAGGFVSYMPLGFATSCKVVARAERIQFYQVNYALYPEGTAVETLAAQASTAEREQVDRIARLWGRVGEDLSGEVIPPGAPLERVRTNLTLASGGGATLFSTDRGGRIAGIRLRPSSALGGKARDLLLRITFDGAEASVLCPAGDFFGHAWGAPAMRSLLVGEKAGEEYCHLPMPFERSAKVELVSERQGGPALGIEAEIAFCPVPRKANEGQFYALWRRENPTRAEVPFTFLEAGGRGHLVGLTLQAQGMESGHTYFFEGDDQTVIDGQVAVQGTGSEDFFNGGWYDVPDRWEQRLSFPLSGCLGYQKHLGRTGGYRWFLGDAPSYRQSIRQTIEHGGEKNSVLTDYCGLTYFYSEKRPVADLRLPKAELRAVHDFSEVILEAAWQMPILGFSFDRAALSRAQAKLEGKDVRVLSYRVTDRDWAGDPFLYFACEMPVAGIYEVFLEAVRGPEAATVQLFQHEAPVGAPVNLGAKAPMASGRQSLGQLALDEGGNNLMLKLVGRPEGAGAYALDLIRLAFRRVDQSGSSH